MAQTKLEKAATLRDAYRQKVAANQLQALSVHHHGGLAASQHPVHGFSNHSVYEVRRGDELSRAIQEFDEWRFIPERLEESLAAYRTLAYQLLADYRYVVNTHASQAAASLADKLEAELNSLDAQR